MTATDTAHAIETAPDLPRGAHGVFTGLSAAGFLVLIAGLVGYGVFGERITDGLDQACAEASLDAGRKLEAQGHTAQAIQKYRQALGGHIADEGERFRCGLSIGDLLYRDRQYNEALAAYRELPEGAFATAGAYAGYVGTLWQLGEVDEALRLTEPWLALALEEGNGEQEVWARKIQLRAAEGRGDTAAALDHYRAIAAVAPGDESALTLARLLAEQGDIAGARAHLERFHALAVNPAHKESARKQLDALEGTPAAPGQS